MSSSPIRGAAQGLRRALLTVVAAALLAVPSRATWSIILVDTSTGEIAIGCATCLTGLDLEVYVPVMLTGVGGACAQSSIDSDGRNRKYIWSSLQDGVLPRDIIEGLEDFDPNHQTRQYGIVDSLGRRATFTGNQAGAWAGGVLGKIGTISYAIQGNVLAGQEVVDAAEQAVRNAGPDLAERLMAGMLAAHEFGGDGRCSCDPGDADSCGSPPPGFDPDSDKSAHIAFMMISRIGDVDGECDRTIGCANGVYYMNLNVADQTASDRDPTLQLEDLFAMWREEWRGRPDAILSTQALGSGSLPGNGTAQTELLLTLNDWEGNPVGHGGATVAIAHTPASAGLATFLDPIDHGDGTYTVPIVAGVGQGVDEYVVTADDGLGVVTLYPFPKLEHGPTLVADATSISASAGGTIAFDLLGPENSPSPCYLLLASASGTAPGIPLCDVVVPLNLDDVMIVSYVLRNTTTFAHTDAKLQPDGTSAAEFHAEPGELIDVIGLELAFAYFTHGPVTFASNPVLVTIDP